MYTVHTYVHVGARLRVRTYSALGSDLQKRRARVAQLVVSMVRSRGNKIQILSRKDVFIYGLISP